MAFNNQDFLLVPNMMLIKKKKGLWPKLILMGLGQEVNNPSIKNILNTYYIYFNNIWWVQQDIRIYNKHRSINNHATHWERTYQIQF